MEDKNTDYKALLPAKPIKKPFFKNKIFLCMMVLAIGVIWDFADPPLWWQFQAQSNKRAILDYAKMHYPNAEVIGSTYLSTELFPGKTALDQIQFRYNEVEFSVIAENGKVTADFYWNAFTTDWVERYFISPFFQSQGIEQYYEFKVTGELKDFFSNHTVEEFSKFDGTIIIDIFLPEEANKPYPESLGWLYEFYCYCKDNDLFSCYIVTAFYNSKAISFTEESHFNNSNEFYNSFFDA